MEKQVLHLNNQHIEIDSLSNAAREDVARTIAFNRDTAIGQLALLGLPEDYEYVPAELPPAPQPRGNRRSQPQSNFDHRGLRLGH